MTRPCLTFHPSRGFQGHSRPSTHLLGHQSLSTVFQHLLCNMHKQADLAEYAPNLRGSGVHGGLIILEPRFNSDTLAMLLNIPPQKTLLRRHLATNFNMLVGSQAQWEKQEYLESSGYTPLTTTAKVRPRKIGFSSFGHRKKRTHDSTDYICPLDASQAQALLNGANWPYSGFRGLSPIFDRDPERQDVYNFVQHLHILGINLMVYLW
uniref:SAM domain-containing protein n=1 Tax=Sinocyclocheilus rhinocerous TaxID=307959 RepID=A0A673IS19_9TELE